MPAVGSFERRLRDACAELDRRLRAGEACAAEDLFRGTPELAGNADDALELIYTEYVTLQELGHEPCAEEFYRRFPKWRDELGKLLEVHELLEPPDVSGGTASLAADLTMARADQVGGRGAEGARLERSRRIGQYELIEEIDRGGMGVVYKARQLGLDRVVALKMIPSPHASPFERARFRAEATAAARLQHPHIVQIFEVGQQDGYSFLSMEFVDGGSLEKKLAESALSPRDAAALLETVARAVHYAHEQGIVHRDLKPANVLLTASGVPRITDFGLAKHLSIGQAAGNADQDLTQSGAILGTPCYMAPEQAGGNSSQIGPAADVYALGAMLYEMTTGRVPFRGPTPLDTLEQVRTHEPVPPRRLQPKLPRDLETICLKSLAKEPECRYPTALALAEELHRFLDGEPVRARTPFLATRAIKWARRQPVVAALSAALVLVTVLGFGLVTCQWRVAVEAVKQKELARQAEQRARKSAEEDSAARLVALANREWLLGNLAEARRMVGNCPAEYRGAEWRRVRALAYAETASIQAPGEGQTAVFYSPSGKRFAAATFGMRNNQVVIYDGESGQRQCSLPIQGHVECAAFGPDDQTLTLVTAPNRVGSNPSMTVTAWDIAGRRELSAWNLPPGDYYGGRFSWSHVLDGGRRLVLCSSQRVVTVWDLASRIQVATFDQLPIKHIGRLSYSADGRRMAFAPAAGTVDVGTGFRLPLRAISIAVCDLLDGKVVAEIPADDRPVARVDLSPDGKRLAWINLLPSSRQCQLRLYDLAQGREIARSEIVPTWVSWLAFTSDGRFLALACDDTTIRLFRVADGQPVATLLGHNGQTGCVAFSPDGRRLVSSDHAGTIKLWNISFWTADDNPQAQ